MDLLEKLRIVAHRIESHGAGRPLPGTTTIDDVVSPTTVIIRGRRTLMFGANNYLGLSVHPDVIRAACEAVNRYGAATTGSRSANGSYALHEDLEREFAATFGMREAVVSTTGYQANLAILGALCGPGDTILLDAESHASLADGARLSGADVHWVRHNSPDSLARKLQAVPRAGKNALVVTEGLYSFRGDVARLADIVQVCREHDAYLLVDEAHSFGTYGARGLGCAEAQGVLHDVDFIVGTFSKALGGVGGFCVSNHTELRMLRFSARAYVFTASGSPASIAAARAALQLVTEGGELRERLWRNLRTLRTGLRTLGYVTSDTDSPILPVLVGAEERAWALWEGLLDEGIYVNVVVSPASPADQCLLRVSCSAVHTADEIAQALDGFATVGRQVGLIDRESVVVD